MYLFQCQLSAECHLSGHGALWISALLIWLLSTLTKFILTFSCDFCFHSVKDETWNVAKDKTCHKMYYMPYNLKAFNLNKCLLSHYLSPNDATQWWLNLWPTDESLQHLQFYDPFVGGDFPRKITSSAQLGELKNESVALKALLKACVWSGVLFFLASAGVASKHLLWSNKQRKDRWLQTMKPETETEVRSKNSPAITAYHHRCCERQWNENLFKKNN